MTAAEHQQRHKRTTTQHKTHTKGAAYARAPLPLPLELCTVQFGRERGSRSLRLTLKAVARQANSSTFTLLTTSTLFEKYPCFMRSSSTDPSSPMISPTAHSANLTCRATPAIDAAPSSMGLILKLMASSGQLRLLVSMRPAVCAAWQNWRVDNNFWQTAIDSARLRTVQTAKA